MSVRIIDTGVTVDDDISGRLVDDNRGVAPLVAVANATTERPVCGPPRYVSECRSEMQASTEIDAANTSCSTSSAMSVRIIDARVTIDGDRGVCLVDDDVCIATLVVVIGTTCEGPVCCSAWYVSECRTKIQS